VDVREEIPSGKPVSGVTLLSGQTVVFAGKLWSLGRKDARAIVERAGGVAEDDVTPRTTLLVVGGETFPEGVPDQQRLDDDQSASAQKLRKAAQLNAGTARIRVVSEDEFCRSVGLPSIAELRSNHSGQRDILARYGALREDHLRYLQKWGFIRPAFRNKADTFYDFSALTLLRQVQTELQRGVSFRAVLRGLQASRSGQLTFDFRIDAHPARIIALKPRDVLQPPLPGINRPLSKAEHYFLVGSLLDDGSAERQGEAAQAYRRALEDDPDLVAALINLANIHYANDELAEAQALYERAILLDAAYFEAHFNLGNIHHDHGRYPEAEICYRDALALNANYADAHFYLAVTLEKMGRSSDARAHWLRYQSLAPDGEWVELAREFSD
jgi:tetratricopeptide (TPR) repeat protein